MPNNIGLDFETYSACDLSKHGLMRYVNDPTFKVLCAAVAQMDSGSSAVKNTVFNFVGMTHKEAAAALLPHLKDKHIVAHNAGFEQAVLQQIGLMVDSNTFIDSAAMARAYGAGSALEAAAPQMLGVNKLDPGGHLVKMFCMPSKQQLESGQLYFEPATIAAHAAEWDQFLNYCNVDAELSLRIGMDFLGVLTDQEFDYMAITLDMNNTGWPVDLNTVEKMQVIYKKNMERGLTAFQIAHDAHDLNLNSLKQLKQWCADRGVKATSFDEKHVSKLLSRLNTKLVAMAPNDPKVRGYAAVRDMLLTKQLLGGSSLKKLQVILDTHYKGRLYDQYVHAGAGQTLRTSGRSVQMQNLKRLSTPADMKSLDHGWTNEQLADNLRQVFTSSHLSGSLIVGDFASVESRGLAWLADEKWKLDAYRKGADLYKVLASQMFNKPVDQITKSERQIGKVGELSCGYGAGPEAVQAFAEKMGVDLELAEASKLVSDWRDANPQIVSFWDTLNNYFQHAALKYGLPTSRTMHLADGMSLHFAKVPTPASLLAINPDAQSVVMAIRRENGSMFLRRYFHGCYERGRNVAYYKPSDRKTGDLWRATYTDPKTKQQKYYELYGGKLAGILTQSFCRELFFERLKKVSDWTKSVDQVQLIGQFHDEIVLDWHPNATGASVNYFIRELEQLMSESSVVSFPMAAEVHADYRYIK